MKFWFGFFLDKRFSFDFKLANLIMRDSLRNYLSCMLIELDNIKNNDIKEIKEKNINKIEKNIKLLMSNN